MEARTKVSLVEVYYDFLVELLKYYEPFHERMRSQHGAQPILKEWIGLYKNPEDVLPKWVVNVGYFKEFRFRPVQFSADFMDTLPKFTIGLQYFTLIEVN